MITTKRNVRSIILLVFVIFVSLYSYAKVSDFLLGPSITIKTPENGSTIEDPFVLITGQAKRISRLYLNDYQIFTDNSGNFNESLLLLLGYNIIKLRAEDNFDRKVVKIIELVSKN